MNGRAHPDILGELFRGEHGSGPVAGLEELEALIRVCLPKAEPGTKPNAKLLPLKRKPNATKRKTTHYLREDVFDGLTQAKDILLRLLPDGSKAKASKSNLVNHAVNQLLREIEEKGLDGPLVKSILGKIE
ncbi:hypothetical protein [Desulfomicrobium escambiense]|uniref:hypothetical protein n=1 Tax=Desulfomicrobium escambiense TaxID=29503 RepID=UPI0004094F7C|nr:hypothetical protein [Desulfomicrobium escambiense]